MTLPPTCIECGHPECPHLRVALRLVDRAVQGSYIELAGHAALAGRLYLVRSITQVLHTSHDAGVLCGAHRSAESAAQGARALLERATTARN